MDVQICSALFCHREATLLKPERPVGQRVGVGGEGDLLRRRIAETRSCSLKRAASASATRSRGGGLGLTPFLFLLRPLSAVCEEWVDMMLPLERC